MVVMGPCSLRGWVFAAVQRYYYTPSGIAFPVRAPRTNSALLMRPVGVTTKSTPDVGNKEPVGGNLATGILALYFVKYVHSAPGIFIIR